MASLLAGAKLLDVGSYARIAYGTRRFFDADRWGLTGEAATSADPLYSPGSDFIALENDFLTDLIARDFAGEAPALLAERCDLYDRFMRFRHEATMLLYAGLYDGLGSFELASAKWDFDIASYYNLWVSAYMCDRHLDLDFLREQLRLRPFVLNVLRNFATLFQRVEGRLRERGEYFRSNAGRFYCGLDGIRFMQQRRDRTLAGRGLRAGRRDLQPGARQGAPAPRRGAVARGRRAAAAVGLPGASCLRLSGAGGGWLVAGFAAAIGIGLLVVSVPRWRALLARFGVRASCAALLVVSVVSIALGGRARSAVERRPPGPAWRSPPCSALGAIERPARRPAAGSRDRLPRGWRIVFRRSLAREDSIIERGARWLVPEAPDFIRPYCRGVTWLWVALLRRERRRDRRARAGRTRRRLAGGHRLGDLRADAR